MKDLKRQFGLRVTQYRVEQGMTQEELAEAINVVQQTIGNIERGIHGPRFDLMEKICVVLSVEPKELFDF